MNEMYPDWGPARHNPEDPRSNQAMAAWLDQRPTGAEWPEDN